MKLIFWPLRREFRVINKEEDALRATHVNHSESILKMTLLQEVNAILKLWLVRDSDS